MNVAVQYPMHSPTKGRPFADETLYSGKPDLAAPRFDNHDDFYAFLDNNRGPPSIPQQQNNHPHSPTDNISRPPVANSFPVQGGQTRSRPPSYSGSRSEEMLQLSDSASAKMHRQNGRRGNNTRPSSGSRPSNNINNFNGEKSPPGTAGSAQSTPTRQTRPLSPDGPPAGMGRAASIQRLKSPSVMNCVLQPLEHKVKEYESLMHREEDQIVRLDDELRALQERREEAQMRFLEAKAKHDDYRRQYHDVERALRGELPVSAAPAPIQRERERPMSYCEEEPDDDEEEELAPPPPMNRRVQSQHSFGRASGKGKSRFRFSLFGGDR